MISSQKKDTKSTTGTNSFRLSGLTLEERIPEVRFYRASDRIFIIFLALLYSNISYYVVKNVSLCPKVSYFSITLPTLRAMLFSCGTRAVPEIDAKTVTIDCYRE